MSNRKCETSHCNCKTELSRRSFIKAVGAGAAGVAATRLPAMAGPFEAAGSGGPWVPADKKLDPEWVKSLFARGEPAVYSGHDLDWVGLPIGGLCTGQVYLGGNGSLWHWDIFNHHIGTGADHYAHPMKPASPVDQGFTWKSGDVATPLEKFSNITFRGEYPFGIVQYREKDVAITLEAFSPFIPLNTDDSSLPATVMRFTVKNEGQQNIAGELSGRLDKAGLNSRIVQDKGFVFLECASEKPGTPKAPDAVFEDWNKETYEGWTVEGTAFGTGPIKKSAIPGYQGDVGGDTERVVNSHATAPGAAVGEKDGATGKLTSRKFTIDRNFITFWIGGGNHAGATCLNLLVGGKVAQSAAGRGDNRMSLQSFDVRKLKGQEAQIEIVDSMSGRWGNIGVGKISFSDQPASGGTGENSPDFGSMGLALLGKADSPAQQIKLSPGKSETVTFVLTWHFPNLKMDRLPGGRYYATKFDSALAVARYVVENFDRLHRQTQLWRDTWYDSTLPYWFLDRTMLNTSILATSTCYRFKNGRFYGWEGVGCCAGTCGHVWQYAHAVARLFPDLERDTRERVDFGQALKPDGAIHFRAEHNNIPAIDAQAGTVLRALREHQMTTDSAFLKRNWPGIRKATEWLIAKDGDADGLIVGNQHNTLDTDWFGPVAWLSGLYLAALQASAVMADIVGDADFAKKCREILAAGQKNLTAQLFDGEYYINKPDPAHLNAINSGTGCEIDQVMGQSWAWQVGLPRVFPEKETKTALQSLWKYNFSPDVGPYRERYKSGRWYAMPGEAGLLMCSFPRSGWDYQQARGQGGAEWAAGYFNECMNGFEYQAASHMVWEGLLLEGLAVTRAVHDRYSPSRRNPYNEVECGDHYARSMASYGIFLAACGYEYSGPDSHLGFAPRFDGARFKAPFTSAEGWGTYEQNLAADASTFDVAVKWGKLRLKTLAVQLPAGSKAADVKVTIGQKKASCSIKQAERRVLITLTEPAVVEEGQSLTVRIA